MLYDFFDITIFSVWYSSECVTRWFDLNDPTKGGDFELLTALHNNYPGEMFIWSTICAQCKFLNIRPKMCFSVTEWLYDLWIIPVFKCKIFKVYLKYTCNRSTLAQSKLWPWTTKPVISSKGIFVAIANNAWVKIIIYFFMPKIIRMLSIDHVPWIYFVNFLP